MGFVHVLFQCQQLAQVGFGRIGVTGFPVDQGQR